MWIQENVVRLLATVAAWQRALVRREDDADRGDVPGWVLVTVMSAALVGVLYVVAGDELTRVLEEALANVIP